MIVHRYTNIYQTTYTCCIAHVVSTYNKHISFVHNEFLIEQKTEFNSKRLIGFGIWPAFNRCTRGFLIRFSMDRSRVFWSLFNIETFHHFTYTFSFIEEYSTVFFFDFLMTHNGILIQSLDADDSSFFHTLFTNRVFMCVTLYDASWCWKAKKRNI